MATKVPVNPTSASITRPWGVDILEERAVRQVRMTGEEFVERYHSGDVGGLNQYDVFDLARLLPRSDESPVVTE